MKTLTFKPLAVAIAACCLLAGAGVALYPAPSSAADEKKAVQKPALTVTTTKPQTSKLPIKLSANGNVAA